MVDLSAAVDVYGEWVDAAGKTLSGSQFLDYVYLRRQTAEAVAKEDSSNASYAGTGRVPSRRDRDEVHATIDRDDSHRYSGDGIVADDEED